ncbi:hypothetical protein ACFW1A_19515 [Kitasatospora sp. NPDC058965]|uniref:hypothetical protein n=1 Tax=Kitasatospora sp. NPDC058965 TaxID=3346682 RepID=UPI0036A1E7C1
MTRRLTLAFQDTHLNLTVHQDCTVDDALEFLATHFTVTAGHRDGALALLRVLPELAGPAAGAEELYVRKSASPFFTVPARRSTEHGRELLECTRTGTRFAFDPAAGEVRVAVGADGQLDLVELVRDLVLKAEENTGAAVLHATAAYRDGSVVLVTGAKGAGKSTVLLELVEKFGYQVMSGDKTLLRTGPQGLYATGWPDYPHLGYGTVAKYPGLREIAGLAADYRPRPDHAFSPLGKFAVDPVGFRQRFASAPPGVRAPVAAVVHPAIGPGERTVLAPAAPDAGELLANLESAFEGAHAHWHHFLPDRRAGHRAAVEAVIGELAKAPAFTLTGPGDLDRDPAAAPA